MEVKNAELINIILEFNTLISFRVLKFSYMLWAIISIIISCPKIGPTVQFKKRAESGVGLNVLPNLRSILWIPIYFWP